MSDDVGERLARIESTQEHNHAASDRWNVERRKEIEKLDEAQDSIRETLNSLSARVTKAEDKLQEAWFVLKPLIGIFGNWKLIAVGLMTGLAFGGVEVLQEWGWIK